MLAWLTIMDFGSDDWIYWHFFTITTNYNSSHTELLLHDVCLTNLRQISGRSPLLTNEFPFYNCQRTEQRSPPPRVPLLLFMSALSRTPCVNSEAETVWFLSVYSLLPGNGLFVAIRCSGNVISEPLLSNGRLLRLHHSGFQPSCHNIFECRMGGRRTVHVTWLLRGL
jgi:hypothetical protein